MGRRFIFTYTKDQRDGNTRYNLIRTIATVINPANEMFCISQVASSEQNRQRDDVVKYALDHKVYRNDSDTWFIEIFGSHTFELMRDKDHGEEGVQELANWLLFLLKPDLTLSVSDAGC